MGPPTLVWVARHEMCRNAARRGGEQSLPVYFTWVNAFRKFADSDLEAPEAERDRLNDAVASLRSRAVDGSRGTRALPRRC
jgi:hypothetical protein